MMIERLDVAARGVEHRLVALARAGGQVAAPQGLQAVARGVIVQRGMAGQRSGSTPMSRQPWLLASRPT